MREEWDKDFLLGLILYQVILICEFYILEIAIVAMTGMNYPLRILFKMLLCKLHECTGFF